MPLLKCATDLALTSAKRVDEPSQLTPVVYYTEVTVAGRFSDQSPPVFVQVESNPAGCFSNFDFLLGLNVRQHNITDNITF